MNVKIIAKETGQGECYECRKLYKGWLPYTVWYKAENESRGHNIQCCSKECAEKWVDKHCK